MPRDRGERAAARRAGPVGAVDDAAVPRPPAVRHERDDRRRAGARRAPRPPPGQGSDDRCSSPPSIRAAADAGRPIVTTGCGTSEHAAMAIAALLDRGARPAGRTRGSFDPGARGRSRARSATGSSSRISHEGGTQVTNEALAAARAAGATNCARSPSGRARRAPPWPGIVILTEEQDQSWCHTVGYLSPLLVGVALAAESAQVQARRVSLSAPSSTSADDAHGRRRRSRRRWPGPIG